MVRRFNNELALLEQACCSAIKAAAAYNSLWQLHCWPTAPYDKAKSWFFLCHTSHILQDYTTSLASMQQCVVQYHTTRWLCDKPFSYEKAILRSNLTALTKRIERSVSNKNVLWHFKGQVIFKRMSRMQLHSVFCSTQIRGSQTKSLLFILRHTAPERTHHLRIQKSKCPMVYKVRDAYRFLSSLWAWCSDGYLRGCCKSSEAAVESPTAMWIVRKTL